MTCGEDKRTDRFKIWFHKVIGYMESVDFFVMYNHLKHFFIFALFQELFRYERKIFIEISLCHGIH